jgi:HEAT repeat protein
VDNYSKLEASQVIASFRDDNPLERLAAVRVARQQQLNAPDELIAVLHDGDPEVCQEARHALVQLASGSDFGPSENADSEVVAESVTQWQRWAAWHKLLTQYMALDPDAITAIFGDPEPLHRWAAVSAARRKLLNVPKELIEMLRDPEADVSQEARQALIQMAGECDFGPSQDANEAEVDRSLSRWSKWLAREQLLAPYGRLDDKQLVAAFEAREPLQRWAAVTVARRRRLKCPDELIPVVGDSDIDVREEARRALKQFAGGADFGPSQGASDEDVANAISRWSSWWSQERAKLEAQATNKLSLAKLVLAKNPQAGRKRLQEIIDDLAVTKAAEEARQLISQALPTQKVELPPAASNSRGRTRPGLPTKQFTLPPNKQETPQAPSAELERQSTEALRLVKVFNATNPTALKERLREIVERYPGTRAALQAEDLLQE